MNIYLRTSNNWQRIAKITFSQLLITVLFSTVTFAGSAYSRPKSKVINLKIEVATVTITGKITDANGLGLPGVTIKVKGANFAAATDNQGNYAITAPDYNATLIFTYLGYTSRRYTGYRTG